ncbi:MAG: hypothetical protein IPK26_08890 [Planctomycetes bacterium]|nr:hypothetical protein [Planctomycetota bacterium]
MNWSPAQRRQLLWLCVAAACWRWVLAMHTPVPAEDGVNYLWMAQQFAAGAWAMPWSEPFPPAWPLLLAVPIAGGADPITAAAVLNCLLGALAIVPIALTAERLRAGAGLPAAVLAATSPRLALTAAEALSEPLFVAMLATAVLAGVTRRWTWLGVLSGLAFWARPEGAGLPIAFVLAVGFAALRAWPWFLVAVAALAAVRGLAGQGFDPLPILTFHEQRDDLAGHGDLLANLVAAPGAFAEAFLLAGGFLLLALLPPRAPHWRELVSALLVGIAGILTFVVRRRFFLSWAPVVFVLGGVGLARLPARWRELLLALAACLDLWVGWHGTIAPDRLAERLVGQTLARRLQPGHAVAGDMTRVLWYAGQRPLPPRHFDAEWLVVQATRQDVQFVVLSAKSRRGAAEPVQERLAATFSRWQPGGELGRQAAARGIVILVRR